MVLRSDQLYLVGKQLGSTNVIVWDARQRPMLMLDVEVTHDLNALKSKLHEFMPEEAIKVQSSQGKLVLSGQVSSAEKMNVALQLARTFTGTAKFGEGAKPEEQNEGTLINMMTIGGAQQVMLDVITSYSIHYTKLYDTSPGVCYFLATIIISLVGIGRDIFGKYLPNHSLSLQSKLNLKYFPRR